MRIITTILFVTFIGININGQDRFHRNYPTSRMEALQLLDGLTSGDISFMVGVASDLDDIEDYKGLVFVATDIKGNTLWDKYLQYDITASIVQDASLVLASNDSLYYSVTIRENGENKVMYGSLNRSTGDFGITEVITLDNSLSNSQGGTTLLTATDTSIMHVTSILSDMNRNIVSTTEIDIDTAVFINQQTYAAADTFDNELNTIVRSVQYDTLGKTIYMSGVIIDDTPEAFIIQIDSLGNPVWSKKYASPSGEGRGYIPNDLIVTPDSSIFLVGLTTPTVSTTEGFISRIDSSGNVVWTKHVNFGDNTNTNVDNVTVTPTGLIIAGRSQDLTRMVATDYHIKLGGGGEQIWANQYNSVAGFFMDRGELSNTQQGGTMYFSTSIDDGSPVLTLIKTDPDGTTGCQDTIGQDLVFTADLVSDTLVWTQGDLGSTLESVMVVDTLRTEIDVPTLELESFTFCPDDPIIFTFDAKTDGAIGYLWSTGATSDTLTVTELGDYSVTVTMGVNVCYTMCDTGRIEQYEEPEIQLGIDDSQFCDRGTVFVGFQYVKDAPIDIIQWSTGETVSAIEVSETGEYEVMVTDICGESVTQSITVDEIPMRITEISTSLDEDFCANNGIELSVSANGNIQSARWSNGAVGTSIVVTEAGTYQVDVTGICGEAFTESITVSPDLIKTIDNLIIETGGVTCVLGDVTLTASFVGNGQNIQWNTGSTGLTTTVDGPGSYTVSVQDECGATSQASVALEECPECLTYPQVFFPNGMEELNQSFGPLLNCGDQVSDYELKVYNQWGNLVFESTAVADEWDGKHGGNDAPSGVYVYFAKYNAGEGDQMTKGDVTLLR